MSQEQHLQHNPEEEVIANSPLTDRIKRHSKGSSGDAGKYPQQFRRPRGLISGNGEYKALAIVFSGI